MMQIVLVEDELPTFISKVSTWLVLSKLVATLYKTKLFISNQIINKNVKI